MKDEGGSGKWEEGSRQRVAVAKLEILFSEYFTAVHGPDSVIAYIPDCGTYALPAV
jgi:hypothetical protein